MHPNICISIFFIESVYFVYKLVFKSVPFALDIHLMQAKVFALGELD